MVRNEDEGLKNLGPSFKPLRWLLNTGPGTLTLCIIMFLAVGLIPVLQDVIKGGVTFASVIPMLITFCGACIVLFTQYGSPMNWWVPYFGHDIKVDFSKHYSRFGLPDDVSSDFKVKDEMTAWLKEMNKGRYFQMNYSRIRFLRKKDAAMFKLVWM